MSTRSRTPDRAFWMMSAAPIVLFAAGSAQAADSSPSPTMQPEAGSTLEEVVVTAEKRTENLQKTPLAISAFTSAKIEQAGLAGPQELQFNVPSMTFGENFSYSQITLRGLGSNTFLTSSEPSVATYMDGVYTGQLISQSVPNFDLERIEVLRGPQGTLYGRNATGGVINYISKPANFAPGAFASVSYGNYNAVQSDVGVTGPLVADKIAGRLSLHFGDHDGYRRNITTGQRADADRITSGRGALLFTPTDNLTATLRGDFAHDHSTNPTEAISMASLDGVSSQSTPLGIFSLPAAALAAIPGLLSPADLAKLNRGTIASYFGLTQPGPLAPNPNKTLDFASSGQPMTYITDSDGGSITVDWDTGPTLLKSISAYRYSHLDVNGNNSGASLPLVLIDPTIQQSRQVTQEFNLSGKAVDDRLDWLGGLFYFHDDTSLASNNFLPTFGEVVIAGASLRAPPGSAYMFSLSQPLLTNLFTAPTILSTVVASAPDPAGGGPLVGGVSIPTTAFGGVAVAQTSQSAAGFAQGTYKLTDSLRLTGGFRYTDDRKSVVRSFHSNLLNTLAGPAGLCDEARESHQWSAETGTIGLDYDVAPQTLSYARVSWGYKAGGANATTCAGFFNPEYVTSYETGLKAVWADGQVLTNAAMYYLDYTSIQTTVILNNTSDIRNAGAAKAFGVELEYAFRPRAIEGLQFDGSASYEHSRYAQGLFPSPTGVPYPIGGNELVRAPKWKASVGAEYGKSLAHGGRVTLRTDAAYTDTIFNDVFNGKASNESGVTQPAYWVVDASLTWASEDGRYQAQLYGKNLTDKFYSFNRFGQVEGAGQFDAVLGQFAPPRTYGLRLTVKLGSEVH
jgi:iron complex outermembrane receptor protein